MEGGGRLKSHAVKIITVNFNCKDCGSIYMKHFIKVQFVDAGSSLPFSLGALCKQLNDCAKSEWGKITFPISVSSLEKCQKGTLPEHSLRLLCPRKFKGGGICFASHLPITYGVDLLCLRFFFFFVSKPSKQV